MSPIAGTSTFSSGSANGGLRPTAQKPTPQPNDDGARSREFDYLLADERAERDERRGLEVRSTGMVAALLVSLTVMIAVAKEARVQHPLELAGAIVVAVATAAVIFALGQLTRTALAEPRTEARAVTSRRTRVAAALRYRDLEGAIAEQSEIVEMIRNENIRLVVALRTATRWLPFVLALLGSGLFLYIAGK